MTDYARDVLSAIIPDRRDLLLYAMQHLELDHFREDVTKNIFNLLLRYYDWAGDVLPPRLLSDLLVKQRVDETKQLLYEGQYKELADTQVPDHEFRYAVAALKDARAEQLTGEAITTAFEILERGVEVDGIDKRGHKDARDYLNSQSAQIDHLDHAEAAPEGDMRHEAKDVLEEYAERKSGKDDTGVSTGIPTLDRVSGGIQNGELALICAYTGEGKTQMCAQLAWDVSVLQNKNVFFGTSETLRRQVRRRIICRHSRLDIFGLPNGLNVRDLRDGTLSEREEEVLRDVVHDLDTNPSYGHIYIAQIPRGATLSFLETRMRRQAEQWEMNLAIFDYLALLKADRRRDSQREELNDILRDAKVFATSFYDGRGIPFVSPWQMGQDKWRVAVQARRWSMANLADTSEAEKSADQIIAILRDLENPRRALLQQLKCRDGEALEPFDIEIDYRNAYLAEGASAVGTDVQDFLGFGI